MDSSLRPRQVDLLRALVHWDRQREAAGQDRSFFVVETLGSTDVVGGPELATVSIPDFRELDRQGLIALEETGQGSFRVEARPSAYNLRAPEQAAVTTPRAARPATKRSPNRRRVFVVHGRDHQARDAMFSFLRSIGLQPVEWSQAVKATRKGSPYVGEVLAAGFTMAQAAVVLLTPDDEARLRPHLLAADDPPHERDLTAQPRPNVLFEAGMAMGLFAERTVLVELGHLRPFSDVLGRHVVRMQNSAQRRKELAQRLQTVGCRIDLSGDDWLSAGDFTVAAATDLPPADSNDDWAARRKPVVEAMDTALAMRWADWKAERDSEPPNLEGGKAILREIGADLIGFRTRLRGLVEQEEVTYIDRMLTHGRKLQQHLLLADGGQSYSAFWRGGDELLTGWEKLVRML